MKLHEGLPLLKEDGSNWLECECYKLKYFYGKLLTLNRCGSGIKGWFNSKIHINDLMNEDWKLHTESKFKAGDLVALKDKPKYQKYPLTSYIEEVMDGEKYRLDNRSFVYEESELTLIMPAQELAEKLGGSENG